MRCLQLGRQIDCVRQPRGTIQLRIARTSDFVKAACDKVWRNLSQDEWNRFVGEDLPYERTCSSLPSGEGAPPDAPAAD